jgi:DNA-binding NarL/FixJ family response regulator
LGKSVLHFMPRQRRTITAQRVRQQKRKLRILIADDHELIRTAVRGLIEAREGWEVCGETANGREVIGLAKSLKPDVVVLDLDMPELHGLEAARQIKVTRPATGVLIFTANASEEMVHDAFAVGVTAYISKNDISAHLVSAIEATGQHKPFLTEWISKIVTERHLYPEREVKRRLTPRQRIVLQLLAEGKTNADVARLLHLSVRTVEVHRAAMREKLGLESFAELVRYAVRERLAPP